MAMYMGWNLKQIDDKWTATRYVDGGTEMITTEGTLYDIQNMVNKKCRAEGFDIKNTKNAT